MKFAYKFNNLLGTVYKKGALLFTPDGNSVISPVGNRISIFDLKNDTVRTLPIASKYNYNALDISPSGCILIAINEEGEAHFISLISQTVVHKYRFKRKVRAVKFSPDGKHFAVCKENNVFVFKAPGLLSGEYNSFIMERVFHGAYDETTCLDWSFDSRILAVGSKDMTTKLYPLDKWKNFRIYSLGNHTDSIVACFFEENSYDITTISKNGQTCKWECAVDSDKLVPSNKEPSRKKKKESDESDEDDIDITKSVELTEADFSATVSENKEQEPVDVDNFFYKRIARHYLADEARKEDKEAILTSAAYHKNTKILVTGFSNGAFFIHELPDINLIHSLSISNETISSVSLNCTGDWIALGCGSLGQLLVWEWQSEIYRMKQQSHSNNMTCICYSIDGQTLASGGEDGKVKLWNVHTGFCFVTFSEHSSSVTSVTFSGTKKFLLSASLDGTVRAFDLIRYRNFRTFASPRPVQFACVAVDSSGEFVAAGGQDVFEIYLWSVKTGKLLEILSGHEGPVSSLAFSPSITSTTLASVSWDKSLRIWDAIEKGSAHETIQLVADGLCVAFKPNGQEVAIGTLDGHISTFNVRTSLQVASIEGRNDLGSGRSDTDLITAKKTLQAKAFTSLCYSSDGEYILAGGQSKNVCIYNVAESLITKRFEITENRSLDAVDDFINRRKVKDFGNIALIEEREEREGGNVKLKLPGARKGDMASRIIKPEVRVFSLQFSPTGQQWAAATTEGLLIYSLSSNTLFDPWDLQLDITPSAARKSLMEHEYLSALTMAIKLNEANLIHEVIEKIPVKNVELLITNLGEPYVHKLLLIISCGLDTSRHLEYYLIWAQHLLTIHGPKIVPAKNIPSLLSLEKSLVKKYEQVSKICEFNKYTIQYVMNLGEVIARKRTKDDHKMDVDDLHSEDDSMKNEDNQGDTD